MSARIQQDREWITRHFPNLAETAVERWQESTPYQKYGMQLPWRTLRRRLASFSKSQKELRAEIQAKKAKEGDAYTGGGLLELCVAGCSDWYMMVDEVLAGTAKAYPALSPSYTVVVCRNPCPSEPAYKCFVNVMSSSSCELTWGGQVGRGDAVDEAVKDWEKRIAAWQEENPEFSDWPHAKHDVPRDTEHSFSWMPFPNSRNSLPL